MVLLDYDTALDPNTIEMTEQLADPPEPLPEDYCMDHFDEWPLYELPSSPLYEEPHVMTDPWLDDEPERDESDPDPWDERYPDELVREMEDPFTQSEPYSSEPPLSDREEDGPSMSEPSSEELDELMEPKPSWMDSSEGSSEVSDADSEK